MKPINSNQLSREYVIEHEGLNILSWDYVIEHGTDFADVDEGLWWDHDCGYYISNSEGIYFTGLLYEVYDNLCFKYYAFYEDGLQEGEEVKFFPSGKIQSYCVYRKNKLVGKSYYWYENGMIRLAVDRDQNNRVLIECDKNGKKIKQGKV